MQSSLEFTKSNLENRKNLIAIFVSGFFFWSSMASQLPTLPLYISTLTKSFDEIGIVMGSFAIGLLATRSLLGKLTDAKGRTYTMRIGLMVAILMPLCYASFQSIPLMICFRAIHGISIAAFASSYSALVSDLAPIANRGKIIGYMSLVNPLGLAVGPAIGGSMYQVWGYQFFFVTASLLALAGLLLNYQIKEDWSANRSFTETEDVSKQSRFWQTFLNARVRVPSTVLLLVGLAFGTISSFMPILMQQKAIAMNAGFFYIAAAIAGFAIRLPLAKLSDAWGRGIFISIGICCYSLSLAIIFFATQDIHFIFSGIVEGIGSGIVIPSVIALLADRTVSQERGYVFGLTWIGFDVGIALAGPLMGKIAHWVGIRNIFAITTVFCALGLVIFGTQSNRTMRDSLKFAIGKTRDHYAVKPQL
ncbi:MAG: MFS transporter [Pseudanabaenaceae cyanobacterium bins.39]|nr:MFS transporter [Pseudanabaenaceae cyanobacterium bins.39]